MSRMAVRDVMTEDVRAVGPKDDVATLRDLLYEHDIRHMPVVDDEGALVGLVTQRDLLRHALIEQPDVPTYIEDAVLERLQVSELMNTEIETAEPDADIRDAAQQMFENKYGCLPVVSGGRLVGILTESDFVRLMAKGS